LYVADQLRDRAHALPLPRNAVLQKNAAARRIVPVRNAESPVLAAPLVDASS
jgi:hypothetical protein